MNKVIIGLVMFMFGSVAFADDMPSYLKDGTITVTLKSGKTYTFSANEYMVVSRHPVTKQLAIAPSSQAQPAEKQLVIVDSRKNNTVKAYGGIGPNGLNNSTSGNTIKIDQSKGAVFGLGYSHQLSREISVEGIGLSNATGLLGVGYSF